MSVLLLGRWDHGGNLVIEESHVIEDGDDETADALVDEHETDNMVWAAEFDVDTHEAAVQRAFNEYVDEGDNLIDIITGFEPSRER